MSLNKSSLQILLKVKDGFYKRKHNINMIVKTKQKYVLYCLLTYIVSIDKTIYMTATNAEKPLVSKLLLLIIIHLKNLNFCGTNM